MTVDLGSMRLSMNTPIAWLYLSDDCMRLLPYSELEKYDYLLQEYLSSSAEIDSAIVSDKN